MSPTRDQVIKFDTVLYVDDLDMVKHYAEQGSDINAANEYRETLLGAAIYRGNYDIVKYLVEKGADVNWTDPDGKTHVYHAVEYQRFAIMKYLCTHGADIEKADSDGITPFYLASIHGKNMMATYLLAHGANINRPDYDGNTALIYVIRQGNLDMVRYLVERGININQSNFDGWTPLMVAANRQRLDMVDYLVKHGADVYLKNHHRQTAEDVSANGEIKLYLQQVRIRQNPIFQFLLKHDESPSKYQAELANMIQYIRENMGAKRSNSEFVQMTKLLCDNTVAKRILVDALHLRRDKSFRGINIEDYCMRPAATTAELHRPVPTARRRTRRRGPITVSTLFETPSPPLPHASSLPPVALAEPADDDETYYIDVHGIRRHVPHMSGPANPLHRISKRGGKRSSRRARRSRRRCITQKKHIM